MRRVVLVLALALIAGGGAATAADFGLYGSYWDTDDLDETFGGGVSLAFPLGRIIDLDLRAAYQEELSDQPLEALFEDDDPVFEEESIRIIPVELGLRLNFARDASINPYLGGGASYFFIDPERNQVDIDDEVGFYVLGGARFGDAEGAAFLVEAFYRQVEARARRGDVGDLVESIQLDVDGFGLNLGVTWGL